MKKWAVLVLLVAVLVAPMSSARAQTESIGLENLRVQIWPEYDKPETLFIFDFSVTSETVLPTTLTFRIPLDANLIAVAFLQNGSLVNTPYSPLTSDGKWQLFSVQIKDTSAYRFEYYVPLSKNANNRQIALEWAGDYAVKTLDISILQPVDASGLQTSPMSSLPFPGTDGLTYYQTETTSLTAGQPFTLNVSYVKSSDALTASSLQVTPSGGSLQSAQSFDWLTYLPWILGGFGLLLTLGGFIWYWQSGNQSKQAKPRKRHTSITSSDEDSSAKFCSQCGKRATPADRFCRTCGTRLK